MHAYYMSEMETVLIKLIFFIWEQEWHPDRWERRNPSMLGEAKRKFQQIQEAYEGR